MLINSQGNQKRKMRNVGKDHHFKIASKLYCRFLFLRYVVYGWLGEDTKGKQSQHI